MISEFQQKLVALIDSLTSDEITTINRAEVLEEYSPLAGKLAKKSIFYNRIGIMLLTWVYNSTIIFESKEVDQS